ncbi:MAG: Ig-like domain-containing protein [Gemmatimonadaceae bacterium]
MTAGDVGPRYRVFLLLALVGCSSTSEQSSVSSLSVTPHAVTIAPGAVATFLATASYSDGSSKTIAEVQWESSAPSVATIDSHGTAVGVSAGTTMIRARFMGFADSTTLSVSNSGPPRLGPLHVSTDNPRYFADPTGRVVYLTGSHYWKNLQDNGPSNPPGQFNNATYLDFLQSHNHNFTRLWVWEQARWSSETSSDHYFSPTLYVRTGPGTALDGGAKFDLNQINPAYLTRLRQRVIDAGSRSIYVSVMLFDGWSVETKPGYALRNPWLAHPFNGSNNVNGVNGDPNGDASGREIQTLAIPAVTALQDSYVRAVVDAVNDLDNVMYEISNESDPSANAWQYHMISLIRSYEATKPKQHPIGMTISWPNGANSDLTRSSADWISVNGDITSPSVATGTKVSMLDTDHICGICGDAAWVWKSLARGHNPIFMDGYDGSAGVGDPVYNPSDPKWEVIRKNLGYARSFALRMDLARAVPHGELAGTGYCLAAVGSEYLVFLPTGGSTTIDLTGVNGSRSLEWFDPSTNRSVSGGTVAGGTTVTITTPFGGAAVAYIHP